MHEEWNVILLGESLNIIYNIRNLGAPTSSLLAALQAGFGPLRLASLRPSHPSTAQAM